MKYELQKSILKTSELLRTRKLSPVELTRDCLRKIEELNSTLNAFITVTEESALAEAREAESEIQHGKWRGPLHGIPIGLKDLIDTAGIRTTAASSLFKDRIPSMDAEVVTRLKTAGAILIGKQNLHEFAYGGSSMVSFYGEVRNPWNSEHIAGGSSGGSAAAVAAGMCFGAIGTDTAGSIREPAALCGVVGFKPTFGRVSTRGVIPLSPSLDHVGPIARSAADAAIIYRAIAAQPAVIQSEAERMESEEFEVSGGIKNRFRIGVPREYFFDDLDPEVEAAVAQALSDLEKLGNQIHDVELAVHEDRTFQTAEAFAYHKEFVVATPELYQPETLRRIRRGEDVSAAEVLRLRAGLEKERRDIQVVFERLDVLVTPTTPVPAPLIEDFKKNPELLRPQEILLLRNTRPANVWGLPAISVPCGFTRGGLPIGLQIIGAHGADAIVLHVAQRYEHARKHSCC